MVVRMVLVTLAAAAAAEDIPFENTNTERRKKKHLFASFFVFCFIGSHLFYSLLIHHCCVLRIHTIYYASCSAMFKQIFGHIFQANTFSFTLLNGGGDISSMMILFCLSDSTGNVDGTEEENQR